MTLSRRLLIRLIDTVLVPNNCLTIELFFRQQQNLQLHNITQKFSRTVWRWEIDTKVRAECCLFTQLSK